MYHAHVPRVTQMCSLIKDILLYQVQNRIQHVIRRLLFVHIFPRGFVGCCCILYQVFRIVPVIKVFVLYWYQVYHAHVPRVIQMRSLIKGILLYQVPNRIQHVIRRLLFGMVRRLVKARPYTAGDGFQFRFSMLYPSQQSISLYHELGQP